MKLNLPAVLTILAGSLLIYGAYTNQDPRNVVFQALGIKRRVANPALSGNGSTGQAARDPEFGSVPDKGYSDSPHNAQGYPLAYTYPGQTVVNV